MVSDGPLVRHRVEPLLMGHQCSSEIMHGEIGLWWPWWIWYACSVAYIARSPGLFITGITADCRMQPVPAVGFRRFGDERTRFRQSCNLHKQTWTIVIRIVHESTVSRRVYYINYRFMV